MTVTGRSCPTRLCSDQSHRLSDISGAAQASGRIAPVGRGMMRSGEVRRGVGVRTVSGPSERIVIVGAGLGGLACALRLASTGRDVTVVEREARPGGRAGRLSLRGYEFDTGPTVLTMPEILAETFAAAGEDMADWLTLGRLDPAYRAFFPDGSSLDVIADSARMADEITRVCGAREA